MERIFSFLLDVKYYVRLKKTQLRQQFKNLRMRIQIENIYVEHANDQKTMFYIGINFFNIFCFVYLFAYSFLRT